jgi:serine/threonine protein kinase
MEIYEPGTEIGQYRILSAPMMGGMGVVYACHDLTNDRAVALKTFKPEFLPDRATREQFLREASAWVRLGSHPNIVRCYGVEYLDPITFLALEFILKAEHHEDASLSDWIVAPMPPAQALPFALQIARGMLHATQKLPGFVHRDLKPDNILVGQDTLPGTNIPRLRVTDFGLVYFLRDVARSTPQVADPTAIGQTHLTQACVGTPLYMAPEQWMSGRMGVFTDVYAFGCILYEMLTGQRAASAESLEALAEVHCSGGLRPIPGNIPKDLSDFLRRCLSMRGSERFQSWQEVIAALEEIGNRLRVSLPPVVQENESIQEQRERAWSFNAIGLSYMEIGGVHTSIGYHEKSLALFREIGDRYGESYALLNSGNAFFCLGDVQHAIGYYQESLVINHETGNRYGEGASLNNLGNTYLRLGDTHRAIGYYEKSLLIDREIGDRSGEGVSLDNLGKAYFSLGDTRSAIEYHYKSLEIARETGNRRGEGTALNNLANALSDLGDNQRAIEHYERSLTIAREIGDRHGEGNSLNNLGVEYADMGDKRSAIECYQEAFSIMRDIGDRNGIAHSLLNLAKLRAVQGEIAHAISLAQEAERIWEEMGNPQSQMAHQLLVHLGNSYPTSPAVNTTQALSETQPSKSSRESVQFGHASPEKQPKIIRQVNHVINTAKDMKRRGQVQPAIDYLQRAIREYEKERGKRDLPIFNLAMMEKSIGKLYYINRQYNEAVMSYLQAIYLFGKEDNSQEEMFNCLFHLGCCSSKFLGSKLFKKYASNLQSDRDTRPGTNNSGFSPELVVTLAQDGSRIYESITGEKSPLQIR